MGQGNSVEESKEIKGFSNNYVFVKKFTDARFGEVKLFEEKNNQNKVLQKDFNSHSAKEYHDYLQVCQKRTGFSHPNIVKLHGYATKKEDNFCADFYRVSFYFEYIEKDLEQEIKRRKDLKDPFPEIELWYILDNTISAGAYLETNQSLIGDIRPLKILITPSCDYKLLDQSMLGEKGLPNYLGLVQSTEKVHFYLAPEIFQNINKNTKPAFHPFKANLFSLGMTLIEAANLARLEQCYDWNKYTFDEYRLRAELEKVRNSYGDNLAEILGFMTGIVPENRPDFKILNDMLNPSREVIRSRNSKKETRKEKSSSPVREKQAQVKSSAAPHEHKETQPTQVVYVPAPVEPVQTRQILVQDPSSDLERRFRESLAMSQETLARYSPQKYKPSDMEYVITQSPQTIPTTTPITTVPTQLTYVPTTAHPEHKEVAKSSAIRADNHVTPVQYQQGTPSYIYPTPIPTYTTTPAYVVDPHSPVPEVRYDHTNTPVYTSTLVQPTNTVHAPSNDMKISAPVYLNYMTDPTHIIVDKDHPYNQVSQKEEEFAEV